MNWRCLILLLGFSTAVMAVEDPPNCSLENGGLGNTSVGGINFVLGQAHVGDTVSVFPGMGMVVNACKALNATGSVWIATGHLTNFMVNVTLNPDGLHSCPSDGLCEPGPYSFLITAPMVGAGVSSPNGSLSGVAKAVRAASNEDGTVQDIVDQQITGFHSATIGIVTPCIQVFKVCGVNCIGSNIVNFTGYVTNCGDINLTNVTVVDDRTNTLYELDDDPLVQPFNLNIGATVSFKGSFVPLAEETSTATNTITASGTDTTTIGGPNASVTNTTTVVCNIVDCTEGCHCPFLTAGVSRDYYGNVVEKPIWWQRTRKL